jgi:hypothetical protein
MRKWEDEMRWTSPANFIIATHKIPLLYSKNIITKISQLSRVNCRVSRHGIHPKKIWSLSKKLKRVYQR